MLVYNLCRMERRMGGTDATISRNDGKGEQASVCHFEMCVLNVLMRREKILKRMMVEKCNNRITRMKRHEGIGKRLRERARDGDLRLQTTEGELPLEH